MPHPSPTQRLIASLLADAVAIGDSRLAQAAQRRLRSSEATQAAAGLNAARNADTAQRADDLSKGRRARL